MRPDGLEANFYFGGGGDTLITPLALYVFLLASALMLLLPRKYVMVPFFIAGFLITLRQQVVVSGVHFPIYRLLTLVGWSRMIWSVFLTRRDTFPRRMNSVDIALVLWACSNAVMYAILWGESQALVNRLGFLYSTLGVYFLLRYLIQDREDVIRAITWFAMVSAVIGVFAVAEHLTGRNAFSIFGGVAELSNVRNGEVRAQGPFLHAIVAGTFGAMQLPLFIALWWDGNQHRLAAAFGVVSSAAITIASASSTPAMTYLAGVGCLCLWPLRRQMRLFRWGLVLSLVTLHMTMTAPVWFLINRVGAATGGTGWHRAQLVDHFIRHFGEWWLIGTQNNANWGLGMWDCINAYVNAGTEGGLVTFLLFIALFTCAYKRVGMARRLAEHDRKKERLIWALGATLFANTVAFFGITYFDQSVIAWYAILVMISVATTSVFDTRGAQGAIESSYPAAEPPPVRSNHLTAWSNR